MRCVVNYAKAAPWPNLWYPRGQQRLERSLSDQGWNEGVLLFRDESELGVPPHAELPYAFKVAALRVAAKRGYTSLLWTDASIFAIKPLNPVFEHIEKHGHLFFHAGFNCAQWTNDRALSILGVTRDEAEKIPMLMALCLGLDLRNERTQRFLDKIESIILHTEAVRGGWTNENKQESADPRCLGHRHDQSVASIIAGQLGMALEPPALMNYYGPQLYQYGWPNDMSRIADSVVLLAQGMMS
jgi:hypothetical protein